MKKAIAFFDFDGTITSRDTLLEFIKFSRGTFRFYWGFLVKSPYLLAYKFKIISNQKAKEKVLEFFFRDMPLFEFQQLCDRFVQEIIPGLIRPQALAEIEKLKANDSVVVIVSASPENWIRQWTSARKLELIATCLETSKGKLTGKIVGYNCHGKEKVRRISEKYNLGDYGEIYAYGDSSGDKPMLSIAKYQFMRPFRKATTR